MGLLVYNLLVSVLARRLLIPSVPRLGCGRKAPWWGGVTFGATAAPPPSKGPPRCRRACPRRLSSHPLWAFLPATGVAPSRVSGDSGSTCLGHFEELADRSFPLLLRLSSGASVRKLQRLERAVVSAPRLQGPERAMQSLTLATSTVRKPAVSTWGCTHFVTKSRRFAPASAKQQGDG